MNLRIFPSHMAGSVLIPPSKSLCHRALICAGFARGESILSNTGDSQDIQATISCLEALGAVISPVSQDSQTGFTTLKVHGCNPALRREPVTLNAKESGSTLRFLIPAAACAPASVTFLGQPSLLVRPLGIYANIFLEQGLPFEQGPQGLHFQGPLEGGLFTLDGDISSQFVSGLLLAGPFLGGVELAVLPPYQSRSYVDLTVSMMKTFGIQIEQPTSHAYQIEPGQHYLPQKVQIESDWSQAAFFLCAGMIQGALELKGLSEHSLQGDSVILSMIRQAGGSVEWKEGVLQVCPNQLHPFVFDLADCPDLGPVLCALGALIPGENRLLHTARLRYKECDRIEAMETELKKWGVQISSDEDSITIQGKKAQEYSKADLITVDGHNDHRIVMAMAVFALCTGSECVIEGAQAVQKSYPDFFRDLEGLGVRMEEVNK